MEGYEFKTTFWTDFTIADHFGVDAIRDTYRRAFAEWKDNVIYLAELALVLNWKCWMHYESKREDLSDVYGELYYQTNDYAYSTLEGDDMKYYYKVLD